MSATSPASTETVHIQHPPPIERIAERARTLADSLGTSESYFSKRKGEGTLAFLDLPEKSIRYLNGDGERVQPWSPGKPPLGEDGRATLAHAFPGRETLTPADGAFSIDVSTRTTLRWIHRGELPAKKVAGRWQINRDVFVAWLLARRVPARWES